MPIWPRQSGRLLVTSRSIARSSPTVVRVLVIQPGHHQPLGELGRRHVERDVLFKPIPGDEHGFSGEWVRFWWTAVVSAACSSIRPFAALAGSRQPGVAQRFSRSCSSACSFFVVRAVVVAAVRPMSSMRSTNLTLAHSSTSLGVAGGEVGNEEPHRSAGRGRQRLAVEPIDQNRPLAHRLQRNAGVKIVARGVQRQVAGRRPGPRAAPAGPPTSPRPPCASDRSG